jgi:hypothetical protein
MSTYIFTKQECEKFRKSDKTKSPRNGRKLQKGKAMEKALHEQCLSKTPKINSKKTSEINENSTIIEMREFIRINRSLIHSKRIPTKKSELWNIIQNISSTKNPVPKPVSSTKKPTAPKPVSARQKRKSPKPVSSTKKPSAKPVSTRQKRKSPKPVSSTKKPAAPKPLSTPRKTSTIKEMMDFIERNKTLIEGKRIPKLKSEIWKFIENNILNNEDNDICNLNESEFSNYVIDYNVLLGTGSFGSVYVAYDKLNHNRRVAIKKTIQPNPECNILKKLGYHPNIIQIIGLYTDEKHFYTIYPLLYKNLQEEFDFLHHVVGFMHFRNIFKQLVDAVKFCHHQNVVHLDIKLENILFKTSPYHDKNLEIVLSDFGLAKILKPNEMFINSEHGAWEYKPPEAQKNGLYGKPYDIWSMGVMLYTIYYGRFPFRNKEEIETLELSFKSKKDKIFFDLLEKMLDKNPMTRLTIDQVANHPWLI